MPDMERLQNLGEETANDLAQALKELLGREIAVSLLQVTGGDAATVASMLEGPYLFSGLEGSGGVEGTAALLFQEKEASVLADLLVGQDGTSAPEKVTELHLSAFGEVVHQIAEAFSRASKKYAGSKALWEGKETTVQDSGEMVLSQLGEGFTVLEFQFFLQDLLTGRFLLCLPDLVAEGFSSGTAAAEAGESAGSGSFQPGVPSMNTQTDSGGASVQQFENELSGASRPSGGNIALLMDVPLKLTVELGRTTKLVKEILALAPGSVVELDKLAGEPVDILVNEKLIAKGEVVVIDENFGVRITEIINPEERLSAVQA